MKYLLYILWKFRTLITLIVLLAISVILMVRYDDFKHIEYFRISNAINNSTRKAINEVRHFYNLSDENQLLQSQNAKLMDTIEFYKSLYSSIDTTKLVKFLAKKNKFKSARVVSNFPNKPNNLIVINKGSNDSIRRDMGVLSFNGIVGQVVAVADEYSLVMPIINIESRVSAKHKNSAQTCSVYWQGATNNALQITDIPIHTEINIGDTILTSGYSAIYPKDIPIGVVEKIDKETAFYTLDIRSITDFSKLYSVHVFDNREQTNIQDLMKSLKK